MSKIVNSAAGNTLFRTNGSEISNTTQPKLNGGAAANVGSNTGNLSSADLVNGYSLPSKHLEYDQRVWDNGIDLTYTKQTGNILVLEEGDGIDGHGLSQSDVGKQVTLDFIGLQGKVGTILAIIDEYTIHIKMTGMYSLFTGGFFTTSDIYNIHTLKDIANNVIMAKDSLILAATANKANNVRESIKSLKTTTAIRDNKLNHSNNSFDSDYPAASNDTAATNLADDTAQEDTRITYKMGIGAPQNTGLA